MVRDDRELVARVLRDASSAAFVGLYERHTPRLLRFITRISGTTDEAYVADLLQETWIRGIKALPRFDWRSSLTTWLHGIALNVTRESIRRDRPVVTNGDATIADRPNRGQQSPEDRIDLERALRKLPEGRRMILVLHDLEGYTHDEIARVLGISAGTSKSQLHDARSQLKQLLCGGE